MSGVLIVMNKCITGTLKNSLKNAKRDKNGNIIIEMEYKYKQFWRIKEESINGS